VAYSAKHGFSTDRQDSSGVSVGLRYDTRDNGINVQRGWLASATYRTFFSGVLGGDSTWQQVNLDVRTYKNLTKNARQTDRLLVPGDSVAGGTASHFPLICRPRVLDGRPRLATPRAAIGASNLRDGEVEQAMISRATARRVRRVCQRSDGGQRSGERLFGTTAPPRAPGQRVLLNKRSRTNVCLGLRPGQGWLASDSTWPFRKAPRA
jgi:hypothetical protein